MNFIEELYYGNINPNEKRYKKATPYDEALSVFTANEDKLKEALSGEHLKLFNDLVNASDEISATNGVENFKIGFRLGVKMMCDSLFIEESKVFKDVLKERF
ncbi:MAG: hypothetical protein UIL37_00410 [Clostridia bacterium]|nr:hypothetical protein [Clostridia bacterium]